MVLFGLIGFPLGHSWSAAWFTEKFRKESGSDKSYHLFPLRDISEFPDLLQSHPGLTGLNVTIPYKEKIIPYLDELDNTARSVCAVNTIRIIRNNGRILTKGFNTDAPGFLETITNLIPGCPALILGTGGAAKAVAYVLEEKNLDFTFVSRGKHGRRIISYQDLSPEIISHNRLIINATPIGMYPHTANFPPIPYHLLSSGHYLYDLIYNPPETQFIKRGKVMKAQTMNGMQMFINQAELSYKIFLDVD